MRPVTIAGIVSLLFDQVVSSLEGDHPEPHVESLVPGGGAGAETGPRSSPVAGAWADPWRMLEEYLVDAIEAHHSKVPDERIDGRVLRELLMTLSLADANEPALVGFETKLTPMERAMCQSLRGKRGRLFEDDAKKTVAEREADVAREKRAPGFGTTYYGFIPPFDRALDRLESSTGFDVIRRKLNTMTPADWDQMLGGQPRLKDWLDAHYPHALPFVTMRAHAMLRAIYRILQPPISIPIFADGDPNALQRSAERAAQARAELEGALAGFTWPHSS